MDIEIDHYKILGLPSGSKLTLDEISKAYRSKALKLHPDKRPNDPKAHTNFQTLKSSYEILKDVKARKLFDDLLRVKREKLQRESQHDSKRRRMVSDLEQRERAAFAVDPELKAKMEEEKIVRMFKGEIERIRAMHNQKPTQTPPVKTGNVNGCGQGLDVEKVLKVTWDGCEDDYSVQKLRELFREFGEVEDIVVRESNKRKRGRCALVVMASRDAAVSAMGTVCGHVWNPLLVLPLHKKADAPKTFRVKCVHPDIRVPNNLVGASYRGKEASVLDKLRKAAEKQKC